MAVPIGLAVRMVSRSVMSAKLSREDMSYRYMWSRFWHQVAKQKLPISDADLVYIVSRPI